MSTEAAKIILKNVVLSYPHLDKPQPPMNEGDTPKHSAVFVFGKTEMELVRAAAQAAANEKWGAKGVKMVTLGGKGSTIRNDTEGKYPEGSFYISARNVDQPGLVYRHAGPDGKKPALVEPEKIKLVFYPGARVNVSLTAFAYEYKVNKGVGFALNSIQKWADDIRLDGRVAAEDTFEADMNETPAELTGLV